jgi:hypothetical protein
LTCVERIIRQFPLASKKNRPIIEFTLPQTRRMA